MKESALIWDIIHYFSLRHAEFSNIHHLFAIELLHNPWELWPKLLFFWSTAYVCLLWPERVSGWVFKWKIDKQTQLWKKHPITATIWCSSTILITESIWQPMTCRSWQENNPLVFLSTDERVREEWREPTGRLHVPWWLASIGWLLPSKGKRDGCCLR